MKYLTLFFCLILGIHALAQQTIKPSTHEVSGIVQDTTETGLPNVTVVLVSEKDTLKMSANEDGIFVFKAVKSAVFTITVSSLGFAKTHRKYFFNDEKERIVLDPIILKDEGLVLKEVQVKGKVGIIYKTDTIEYRASDYKVREYANVGDLLRKMEGIEVDKEGKVTHNGEAVTDAKFNGKKYFNGNIAETIKELPADIVEKIQIIDDYGDQAALSGIKSGTSHKVLNVVSKADKSIGNLGELSAEGGNDNRYGFIAGARQINNSSQIGLKGVLNQTQAGIADKRQSTATTDASEGKTQTKSIDLSFSNSLGKQLELEIGYKYDQLNNNIEKNSNSTELYNSGYINSAILSQNLAVTNMHLLQGKLIHKMDAANRLIINTGFNGNKQDISSQTANRQSGIIQTDQLIRRNQDGNSQDYHISALYVHHFKAEGQTLSTEMKYVNGDHLFKNEDINNLVYYAQTNVKELDSIIHLETNNNSTKNILSSKTTYTQPLSLKTKLDFTFQYTRNAYRNSRLASKIEKEISIPLDSLNSVFNYAFTETRLSASYAYDGGRFAFNVGAHVIPTLIDGASQTLGSKINRSNLNLAPVLRFTYRGSKQMQIALNYNAQSIEPTFEQLQPIRDISNLQNITVGNPDLKTAFRHAIGINVNKYFTASGISFNMSTSAATIKNRVVRNMLIIPDTLNSFKRETRFLNINGDKAFNGFYNISKNFVGGIFGFEYSGSVNFNYIPMLNNNERISSQTWFINQRLSGQLNLLSRLEVNPSISYSSNKTDFSLPQANDFYNKKISLGLNANFYFSPTAIFTFDGTKNRVSGISANETQNPFILNAGFSQRLFKRKNALIGLKAYDIFKQNNFINRRITDNGIVDTKTNTLSRYLMLSFSWTPQKWTGPKGSSVMRNGDGSFRPSN